MNNFFTEREREVINLLLEGLNNKEISRRLVISNHTTKAHVASIYKKLGVSNRVQAVVECLKPENQQRFGIEKKNKV